MFEDDDEVLKPFAEEEDSAMRAASFGSRSGKLLGSGFNSTKCQHPL